MTGKTRIEGLSKGSVLALALGLLLWIAYGLSIALAPTAVSSRALVNTVPAQEKMSDLKLYQTISQRVAAGEDYYTAAATLQREQGYPLKPFVTMRLPTLATIIATLGMTGAKILLWVIMGLTLFVWWRRFEGCFADPGRRLSAILLLTSGLTIIGLPNLVVLHDAWAGLLVTLALGLHGNRRIWLSLVAVAAAILIRETILPIAGLFLFMALLDKQWKSAGCWGALILAALGVLMLHAQAVAAVTLPNDLASQGWLRAGGWGFALQALGETTALRAMPEWAGAILVPLSLAGWFSWADKTGRAVSLAFLGYTALFMAAGRLENFYWGLWVSPLLLAGLAFVPQAVLAAVATIRPGPLPLDRSATALS